MPSTHSPISFKLNTGALFPGIGFGTYSPDPKESYTAVLQALKIGYRHLDTAYGYENEREVGKAIREFLESDPSVKREDIFVTTKITNHLHEPEDVEWCLNSSLEMLGLDYVDIALIHWPVALEKDTQEKGKEENGKPVLNKALTDDARPTWEAMEKLYHSGKAKAIGVSNWTIPRLERMLSYAKVVPACNQVEVHPFLPNTKLLEYCKAHDIVIAAYSPLGGQGTGKDVFSDKLSKLAEKQGHTVAQVLLAWGLRRGYAVLPKSFTPSRMETNLQVVDLSDEEFEAVSNATGGEVKRFCHPNEDDWGIDVWANGEE